MSGVPKGRREKHDFLATHNLMKIRKEVTELAVYSFGYNKERQDKKIERFEEWAAKNGKEDVIAWMRAKNGGFYEEFVEEETRETRQILRNAVAEYELGNTIFPSGDSKMEEYREKRAHLNRAAGHLHVLIQELQYIADILPCDKNKYAALIQTIREEIRLIKGVRRAANKYLREQPRKG